MVLTTRNTSEGDGSKTVEVMPEVRAEEGASPLPASRKLTVNLNTYGNDTYSAINVSHGSRKNLLTIQLHRTIRVPDNHDTNALPPSMGEFSLYKVSDYAARMPDEMVAKGGLFIPMYQREAMWVQFHAQVPFAIKMYVGGVNAVSGLPAVDTDQTREKRLRMFEDGKSVQDYMVVPDQPWLDGIVSEDGKIRQFVAKPKGTGFSVEAQVTGQEAVGGMQFEIIPALKRLPAEFEVRYEDRKSRVVTRPLVLADKGLGEESTWLDVKKVLRDEFDVAVQDQTLESYDGGGFPSGLRPRQTIDFSDDTKLGDVYFPPGFKTLRVFHVPPEPVYHGFRFRQASNSAGGPPPPGSAAMAMAAAPPPPPGAMSGESAQKPPSLFGAFAQTTNAHAPSLFSGPTTSLFGSNAQPSNALSTSVFSNNPKPLFGCGGATSNGSVFGNPVTAGVSLFDASQGALSLFGAPPAPAQTGGLFGSAPQASGNGFCGGLKSAGPPFAAPPAPAPCGGLFGVLKPAPFGAPPALAPSGGLFGSAPQSSSCSLFGSSSATNALLPSGAPPSGSSLFGAPPASAPSGGLFSSAQQTSGPWSVGGSGSLFQPTFGAPSTSHFAAASTSTLSGGLFGSAAKASGFGSYNGSCCAPGVPRAGPSLFGPLGQSTGGASQQSSMSSGGRTPVTPVLNRCLFSADSAGVQTTMATYGRAMKEACDSLAGERSVAAEPELELAARVKAKVKEMSIAAGGFIKQTIAEDPYPAGTWDTAASVLLNVQIVDPESFCAITGLPPPETPVSAETYAQHGYPFFEIWGEEKTGVKGDFAEVKSVARVEKERAEAEGRTVEAEKSVPVRMVQLHLPSFKSTFRPVAELTEELKRMKIGGS